VSLGKRSLKSCRFLSRVRNENSKEEGTDLQTAVAKPDFTVRTDYEIKKKSSRTFLVGKEVLWSFISICYHINRIWNAGNLDPFFG